ncbi:E3 ubiquitin-protein ligase MARCH6 [Zootermopsis nevadensis]|uniref:RING-type E3 ubiquitin transferase n=1 Tax=Zootermopsis nevadensis TaxID=136037 RepID=A0A067RDS4_ZOONE|nr:E3 ubiquitin-protein ligase MARCH6 [Zootermopsis nevadensis]
MLIHWLVGMAYVYCFAQFILLLREVLRPGVLWFLRNLNYLHFSPIQILVILDVFILLAELTDQKHDDTTHQHDEKQE